MTIEKALASLLTELREVYLDHPHDLTAARRAEYERKKLGFLIEAVRSGFVFEDDRVVSTMIQSVTAYMTWMSKASGLEGELDV